MYDIIIDVIVDGRTLTPDEIPPAVSEQIMAAQQNGDMSDAVREIEYAGVCYQWSVRPCVYP